MWHKYAYSSPAEDPKCSEAEKVYISAGRKVQSKPIKSSYTGAIVSLTGGNCSFFRNFVRNASVRHIREKLAVRVHKCDANGKYGRKDMLGITPRLDDNAISYGTSKRRIMDFLDKFPLFGTHSKEVAKSEDRDRVGRQFALWRRYWSTIVSGACRFSDRLEAAKIFRL